MRTAAEIQDELHELAIKQAELLMEWAALEGCLTLADYRRKEMERLIALRSPDQVARMEAAIEAAL